MNPIYVYSGSSVIAEIDDYIYIRWVNSWWGMDQFEIVINRFSNHADLLDENVVIQWNGHQGIIEDKLHKQGGSEKDDLVTWRGTNYGLFHHRICWNGVTSGTGYDLKTGKSETVMKYYVNKNCIDTDGSRVVPNLTLEPDTLRGSTVNYRARLQYVYQVLDEIGQFSGLGWEVSNYQFKVLQGIDRSVSQSIYPAVILKSEFGNIENQTFEKTTSKTKNLFYLGDASTGVGRTWTTYGSDSGLTRKEMFADARDLSTNQQRLDRGLMLTTQYGATYSVNINYLDSMFHYGTDFNLGDIISYVGSDIVADIRIIEAVESCSGDKLDINLTLNKQGTDFLRLYKYQNILNSPSLRR